MRRWLRWSIVTLVVAFLATYGGDWAIFKLRGSPQGKVTVNRYMAIPLKGNRQEFDYLGTIDVACSISLFPQAGKSTCWHLRQNTNQFTTV